jgi:uncharacterized protein (DUF2267 family)
LHQTRREFLQELKKLAGLQSLDEADFIAKIVIGLIKERIGPELSDKIANSISQNLAMDWRSIALPSETTEQQKLLFKLEEITHTTLRATRSMRLDATIPASAKKKPPL